MPAPFSARLRARGGLLLLLLLPWSGADGGLYDASSPSTVPGPRPAQVDSGTYLPAGPMAPAATTGQTSLPVSIDKVGPPFPRNALQAPIAEPARYLSAPAAAAPTPRPADELTYDANAPPTPPLIRR